MAKKLSKKFDSLSQKDQQWVYDRQIFIERYCPDGCNKPTILSFENQIDLKDNLMINGNKALLNMNPSFILKDKVLNEWLSFCELAHNGLFPNAGGSLDQDPEFLEFYEIYCNYKNILVKSQEGEKQNE